MRMKFGFHLNPEVILSWSLQIEFYGDFDGSFHKSLDLMVDLSAALLGPRSHRYKINPRDLVFNIFYVFYCPTLECLIR